MNYKIVRIALVGLEAFVGLTAVIGGVALVTGAIPIIQFQVEWLQGTPFSDYTIPRLALVICVGGSSLFATATILTGRKVGVFASALAGLIMIGFEAVEVAIIDRYAGNSLAIPAVQQVISSALGLAIFGLAAYLWMAEYHGHHVHTRQVDVDGTRLLLEKARRWRLTHHLQLYHRHRPHPFPLLPAQRPPSTSAFVAELQGALIDVSFAATLTQQPLPSTETDATVPASSDSVLPSLVTGGPGDGKPSAPPPLKGITRRQVLIGGGAALLVAGGLAIWRLVQNGLSSKRNMNNQIIIENALPGTNAWKITKGSTTQIQGYVSATSVDPGGLLTVYVSTQVDGSPYSISVYRLGWYGGLGATLKLTVNNLVGQAQGYWDNSTKILLNCSTCYADPTTHLLEARFAPSYTLKVPTNWTTGVYLLMFTDTNGYQSYSHFVVRGNPSADYVLVRPNTTDQAYNNWGGHSLYTDTSINNVAARKVSFDRPSTMQHGSDGVLEFEAPLIHWLERQGYDLSYLSDINIHANSALLLQHKAYLSIGHDEYWTLEMRNGVEAARDAGVGLAFMGADTCDWQCRLEASGLRVPNRTVVCYKVATGWHPGQPGYLPNDPLYGVNNSRVTTAWNDPVVNRPTATLVGLYYSHFTSNPPGFPWVVDPSATSPYLEGTGLVPGRAYGCNLVGYEWDKIQATSPANIQVIGTSPTVPDGGGSDTSNTITYVAASGSLVFATGSIYWTYALDSYRYAISNNCMDGVVPGMQILFANIMQALVNNSRAIPNS